MEVATHFSGVRAKGIGQASERQIRPAAQQLKRSASEHMRGLRGARAGTPRQPVNPLPKLGSALRNVGPFHDVRGAVDDRTQLIVREAHVEGMTRLVREHARRVARVEPYRIQIQVGRRVKQNVVLRRGERDEFTGRDGDLFLPDTKGRRAAHDEVELRLSVKMARAAPADRIGVFPNERLFIPGGEKALMYCLHRSGAHRPKLVHRPVSRTLPAQERANSRRWFLKKRELGSGGHCYIPPQRWADSQPPRRLSMKNLLKVSSFLAAVLCPQLCFAVGSAELYTSKSYGYGRFEARVRFAPSDGVVSAFFLWKDGSEKAGTFWNELDFEKIGADCRLQSNAIYGNPGANHTGTHTMQGDLCGAYHTYAYEWTADTVTWLLDGAVIRKDTGATAQAFAENATGGMQFHFNLWPGDASFGGNLNPASLPVHQYIDWVQYSTYENGAFTLAWREDFTAATLPDGWLTGNWPSPKNKSTHAPENVNFINGFAVLSLTADDALGPTGAMPGGASGGAGSGGAGSGGAPAGGGSSNASAGSPAVGGAPGSTGTAGAPGSSETAGAPGSTGTAGAPGAAGAAPGSSGSPSGAAGTGTVPGGAAPNAAGSSSGASSDGCSLGHAPGGGASWWALGIPAMAFLRRRRRSRPAA